MENILSNINNAVNSDGIVPFDFNGSPIRVLIRDGYPWFVATDVAKVLGYRNAPDMTRMLNEYEMNTTHNVRSIHECGNPNMTIINEPGLYKCIFNSRRPEAVEFQNFVYTVVLPSIRQYGAYITPEVREQLTNNPNLINELNNKINDYENKINTLNAQNMSLIGENNALNDHINDIYNNMDELSCDNSRLYSRNEELANQNVDLTNKTVDLNHKLIKSDEDVARNNTYTELFNTLVDGIVKNMCDRGII